MRISDWSSDVCSSDLTTRPAGSALIGLPQLHNCDHERDGCDRQLSCFICCQITSPPLSERICEGPLSQSLALARWGLYNGLARMRAKRASHFREAVDRKSTRLNSSH